MVGWESGTICCYKSDGYNQSWYFFPVSPLFSNCANGCWLCQTKMVSARNNYPIPSMMLTCLLDIHWPGKNKPFCHLTCLIHFDPQLLTTTHQHFVAANDKNWLDRISSVCISTLSNMMDAITVENVQHKKKWENLSSQSCLIFGQHGAAPSLPSLPSHLPSLILYQVSKGKYH